MSKSPNIWSKITNKNGGNAITPSILLGFQLFKNKIIAVKLKNNVSLFSKLFWSKQNWASNGVSAVFCSGILDQMLGDLDKMIGNWKNKSSENLEPKFGGNLPQLSTEGISR